MIRNISLLAAVLCLAALAGCDGNPNRAGMGRVTVRLTDAPADYEQVNLVVDGVSIHRGEGETGTWEDLTLESQTFDLLELRNGVFTTLAIADVPAGHYSEIRLLLGDGSTVVVDGVEHPLVIPSGASSGLKIKGDFDVVEGEERELTLDFDAARSIHQTGNGRFMLRPVVRLIVGDVTVETGRIAGRLLPAGIDAEIQARQGTSTLQTTAPEEDGDFILSALAPGSYDVFIAADGYRDTTLTGIAVEGGATTQLGDIQLQAGSDSSATAAISGSSADGSRFPRLR